MLWFFHGRVLQKQALHTAAGGLLPFVAWAEKQEKYQVIPQLIKPDYDKHLSSRPFHNAGLCLPFSGLFSLIFECGFGIITDL